MKLNVWLGAARLRTLPLALACSFAGLGIAYLEGPINSLSASLTILTIILLQVLSNFANDLGDFTKGTDGDERVGPKRALQSGIISESEMKVAVVVFSILSLVSGISLLTISLTISYSMLILFIVGLVAIGAALKYTLGKKSFAYSGLGDIVVFTFFGVIGLLGTVYLQTGAVSWINLIPASSIGFLAASVLNLNNLRDHINDANHSKETLVVRLGYENGKIYHGFLLSSSLMLFVLFGIMNDFGAAYYFCLVPYVLLLTSMLKLMRTKADEAKELNQELGKTAISTALISIGFAILINV